MSKELDITTFPRRKNLEERGLRPEREDVNVQINPRDKHKVQGSTLYFGNTYENEWHQLKPYFWTREGNSAGCLLGHYRGSVGFLLCGGPSFKDVDKTLLKYCWTMAVNNSPKTHRPDAWVSVDDPTRFLRSIWLDPKIMKFQPYSMPEKQLWDNYQDQPLGLVVGDCPNVYYYKRNSKFHADRWLCEDSLNWGNADKFGGGRSVMLVAIKIMYLLGFRTIYLLGCDFDMSEKKTYHFDEKRDKGAVNCNLNTYRRMNEEYFPALRPHFENAGLDVFNCNPKSNLTAFDHVPVEEAVKHAMQYVGDIDSEPSFGLYEKPEDKMKRFHERMKSGKDI